MGCCSKQIQIEKAINLNLTNKKLKENMFTSDAVAQK